MMEILSVYERIKICTVVFLVSLVSCCAAARGLEVKGAVFTIHKALNIELFLNLSSGQSENPYDLNPRTYSLKSGSEIKAAGFDAVRLAVEPAPLLAMKDSERREVYPLFSKVIDEFVQSGLNVIFDIHVTGRDPVWNLKTLTAELPNEKFKEFTGLVESIAHFLRRYDPHQVALELFNEPACVSTWRWSQLQQILYAAARSVIPEHTLILTGPCWSPLEELVKIDPSQYDSNTLYTFHFYQPILFTFQGIPWLEGGFNYINRLEYPPVKDRTAEFLSLLETNASAANSINQENKIKALTYMRREIRRYFATPMNRDWLKNRLAVAQRWARAMKISSNRIFVGEFGAGRDFDGYLSAAREDRLRWLRDVRVLFEEFKFPWAVWSDCCAYGILADTKGPFDSGALHALGLSPAAGSSDSIR